MEGGKSVSSSHRHRTPRNSPSSLDSPDRKRVKLHIPPNLPPKPSHDKREKQNNPSEIITDPIENDVITKNYPKEATPENLDADKNSGENVLQNSGTEPKFSVTEIPQYCRMDFGIPDFWRLDNCNIAKGFWYDENFSRVDHVKYFIALHNDDETSFWHLARMFTLKEQIGLQMPTTFKLCFNDILSKIRNAYEKSSTKSPPRVWLDVRDFSSLFTANFNTSAENPKADPVTRIKTIEKLVTHFTFGGSLYSERKVSEEKFLSYIVGHLKNLEYLCIQDELILSSLKDSKIHLDLHRHKINLPKVKTIRLIHVRSVFSYQFLVELVERCPNLENIHGMPLHLLEKIDRKVTGQSRKVKGHSSDREVTEKVKGHSSSREVTEKVKGHSSSREVTEKVKGHSSIREVTEKVKGHSYSSRSSSKVRMLVRSIFISRNHYSPYGDAPYFFKEISNFTDKRKSALFEWNTRTFFIHSFSLRVKCAATMSNILRENADTLQKLVIEPPFEVDENDKCEIYYPTLPKCTAIELHLMTQTQVAHSVFPSGFDPNKKFPSLTHFEMVVDRRFFKEKSQLYPTYGKRTRWAFFDDNFPPGVLHRPFETVKVLALINFSPYEIMPRVAELFPNLRVLRMTNGLLDVASVLHLCYKYWPRLQQLILEINTDTKFGNLDAGFTGVAQQTVKTLVDAVDPTSPEALAIVEKNRIKLPISHLKELQLVKIILRSSELYFSNENHVFTPFSIFFGFGLQLFSNVKIQICFNDRVTDAEKTRLLQTLRSVRPYIELDD